VTRAYDVAVVGLGAMGSAAAYHAARKGARVIGFDLFAPPHDQGSSHGETRIIREAYFEDPRYVPLVQRAYTLWRELEQAVKERLLLETGGLMIGRPGGVIVRGAKASADQHGLPYKQLDAAGLSRRFPMFTPAPDVVGIWEPRAGVLFPEACVRAHLSQAQALGTELHTEERVQYWKPSGEGFEVATSGGRYLATHVVLAANAWLDRLLPGVKLPLTVTRQPLFWFEPRESPERFAPERMPIYIWERGPDLFYYGFPAFGGLLKVARHMGGRPSDPDALDRAIAADEFRPHRTFLFDCLPGANGEMRRAAVCMYASTPDQHFLIDRHPGHRSVLVISACSGHGFKFSGAIGELASRMLLADEDPGVFASFRWRW
jgi:sarcosine oxidase